MSVGAVLEQLPEQQSVPKVQTPPLGKQLKQVKVMGLQLFEQQSAFTVQLPAPAIQQVPLLHVWPVEQPGAQLPPQRLSPHVLFVQLGVQHELLTQVWPELQSVFTIQPTQVDVLVSQTSPEQQSLVLAQPVAPFAIQGTQ
jgi:hypothetical protein